MTITYPSGRVLVITRDVGELIGMSLSANAGGTPVPLISNVKWEPFGPVSGWDWHMTSGLVTHLRQFDLSGRIVRYPLGNALRDVSYDAADRITGFTHLLASDGTAQPALDQSFGYDENSRLTSITTAASSWSIAYDPNGNRTSVSLNGNPSIYTTEATSNRLTSITNPARSFGYDNAGNTTSAGYTATYALSGSIASITKAGVTGSYDYDAQRRRIRKVTSTGETVIFVYDLEGQLLGEYDQTGKALREYVWLDNIPVAMFMPDPANASNPPLVFYIHADHLNAPRIVVDRNGAKRWRWLAEPFGTTAPETNPDGLGVFTQNLRFPGQYADNESGLWYNYFRFYAPEGGSYVQSDPIGLGGGINTYGYVGGNPIQGIDRNGLDCTSTNGETTCSTPYSPIVTFPTPPGFPASLNGYFYHYYDVLTALRGVNPDCVRRAMNNAPTPGSNPRPASSGGTLNDARVFKNTPNPVMSYLVPDGRTGRQVSVNVTIQQSQFRWGYVVHWVDSNGIAHTSGEGNAWIQGMFDDVSIIADYMVWAPLMQEAIDSCKCTK
ncbi:RHS repeat domain-containing protein [Rhizobacter sp. OV335]|uniref:RHS repeat domain-containing protein n=1 Tax=Rhizobacter sp. OV335 TaxID=1500264 RepID=UPI00091F9D33|nr:RHS repeat-associated core domain-containing protein [Rhizobacter sp. OV335]SHN40467.1 RHS repeat-associated core domain-containing protein [Rhizobacter sp. OV335]